MHESIAQHRDRRHAEQRAMHRAHAAENARAAEHHGGDRKQLVSRARIRLRLAKPRGVDDRRQRRDDPGEDVG